MTGLLTTTSGSAEGVVANQNIHKLARPWDLHNIGSWEFHFIPQITDPDNAPIEYYRPSEKCFPVFLLKSNLFDLPNSIFKDLMRTAH